MTKRRSSCSISAAGLLLFALAVLCLGILLVSWAASSLPGQAVQAFGPPAPSLDPIQRVYLSAMLFMQADNLTQPQDPNAGKQPFKIGLGESTLSISQRLQMEGLIANAEAFRNYLIYAGLDTTLQAGNYNLSASMPAIEIAHALQNATPSQVVFRILPGWRLEEIAAALPTSGLGFSSETFLEAAAVHPLGYSFSNMLPFGATLEGFLFPDVYKLGRDLSVDGFINTLLNNFESQVSPDLREGFQRQNLNLFQAVTLASMVQREAVVDKEMPLIASVFYNRLTGGIKLDSDPTVQYALGYNRTQKTWWTNPLSLKDLKTESPYNTYLAPGLPPGPISNPSLNALRAVASPAQTNYYYFRAACDGSGRHVFAHTLDEHIQNACP